MTTTREAAMSALESVLAAAYALSSAQFLRDPEQQPNASASGLVIMTDGDPGQPEYSFSPFEELWEHPVPLEISASGVNRRTTVDSLVSVIEPALAADRTLGGKVDEARVIEGATYVEQKVEGTPAERIATVHVTLIYATGSGAG